MRKSVFIGSVLTALALPAVVVDGFAAKINNEVVTYGDVTREIQRSPELRAQLAEAKNDPAAVSNAYDQAVNALVNRRLILQAARAKKMEMQEWVIENRIREIIKDAFDGDRNKLNAELALSRTPYNEWYDTIRDGMIIDAMRYQIIEKDAVATPAAMRAEYEKNKERYAAEASTSVRVILLKPPAEGDAATPTVSTRAEEIQARLAKGDSFESLAKKYSADSHANKGGLWKDVKPEEAFRSEIADVIAKLKVGATSELINLDGWGFIVQKVSETHAHTLSFEEAYDDIARNVKMSQAKERYTAWTKRLRAAAFVKIYPMPEQ